MKFSINQRSDTQRRKPSTSEHRDPEKEENKHQFFSELPTQNYLSSLPSSAVALRIRFTAFDDHPTMYVTAVINKIQGKAKDIICLAGNPDDFRSVKDILINALGDRQELSTYKCQLWQFRMTEGMSVAKYNH